MSNNQLCIEDYIIACLILADGFVRIHPCDIVEDGFISHYSKMPSPEEIAIKKDTYEKLSEEAKEIITTILNSPEEILELLSTPKNKNITVRTVRKFFSQIWISKFITENTIKDIAKWVNQL